MKIESVIRSYVKFYVIARRVAPKQSLRHRLLRRPDGLLAMTSEGFLILEALMTLLILAVAFTAFMGAMAQALRVSVRANRTTDAVSQIEPLLFEIESGVRADLAGYGGRGDLKEGGRYRIEARSQGELGSVLKGRFSTNDDRAFLDLDVLVLKAPVQ